jgi:hypothetical protein
VSIVPSPEQAFAAARGGRRFGPCGPGPILIAPARPRPAAVATPALRACDMHLGGAESGGDRCHRDDQSRHDQQIAANTEINPIWDDLTAKWDGLLLVADFFVLFPRVNDFFNTTMIRDILSNQIHQISQNDLLYLHPRFD